MINKKMQLLIGLVLVVMVMLVFIVPALAAGGTSNGSRLLDQIFSSRGENASITEDIAVSDPVDQALFEEQMELERQFQLIESEETNRFIVKYKDDNHTEVVLKASGQEDDRGRLERSFDIGEENSKEAIAQSFSFEELTMLDIEVTGEEIPTEDRIEQLQQALQQKEDKIVDPTVAAMEDIPQIDNGQIIILTEKQNAAKYIEVVLAEDVNGEIEYIQPDYTVEFASLEKPTEEEPTEEETTEELTEEEPTEEEPAEAMEEELRPEEKLTPVSYDDKVVVGIIDTGIDIEHNDLEARIWINTGEITDNGIDDDDNGYIDDVNGWNFYDDNSEVYDEDAGLGESHGTHIAGIIAGLSDGEPDLEDNQDNVMVMPLKVFSNGTAYTSDIIAAIEYAESQGVQIINCSWGCGSENPALEQVMAEADILFVIAAGNSRVDLSQTPVYPAVFDIENKITVTSCNEDGGLSYFSNYSEDFVDIAALGRDIESTLPNDEYGPQSGTSMATAMVTAGAATILAEDSSLDIYEIKDRLLTGADKISPLVGRVRDAARMNVEEAAQGNIQTDIQELDYEEDFERKGFSSLEEAIQLFNSSPTVQLVAGWAHTLTLKQDGTVWAWGVSESCGIGGSYHAENLTQVIGLTNIIYISSGYDHNLAIKDDGTVWAWGNNAAGQLGDGTTTDRFIPIQVSGLTNIAQVAGGEEHSIALKNDGTVWSWGENGSGQLGNGATTDSYTPVQVSNLTNITQIASGYDHNIVIKNDGTAWSWGYNYYGQLGDGTTTNSYTPVQISVLTNIIQVAGGKSHSLAVKNDGTAWAWGRNTYGQLGDGSTTSSYTPVQVSNLANIVRIIAGEDFSLATKNDGTAWTWGNNWYGQLGDNTYEDKDIPIEVNDLTNVTQVAAGDYYSVALKNDNTIWSWGSNNCGCIGDGSSIFQVNTAIPFIGLTDVMQVEVGDWHCLVLKNDGTVWAWGDNYYGLLGNGSSIDKYTPVQVNNLSDIEQIAVGNGLFSLALKENGTVWGWGRNNLGQLGDGTTSTRRTPVQVSNLTNVNYVAAGDDHSIAVKDDGTVWAWGYNCSGQLGNNTTTDSYTPVQVSGLTNVIQVAAGDAHSIAVKNDGTVWAWGENHYGELGDGTTIDRYTPVQVSGLTNVKQVAAGTAYCIAVKNDGTVWAWGFNRYGQLGDGTTTNRYSPVQVSGIINGRQVAAGSVNSLILKQDASVLACGYNNWGQLGIGNYINSCLPVEVRDAKDIAQIESGWATSLAVKEDGTVEVWGDNRYWKLGLFTISDYPTPIQSWTVFDDYPDNQSFANINTILNTKEFSGEIQTKQDIDWLAIKAGMDIVAVINYQTDDNVQVEIYDYEIEPVALEEGNILNMVTGDIYYFKVYYDEEEDFEDIASYNITITPQIPAPIIECVDGNEYIVAVRLGDIGSFSSREITLHYDTDMLQLLDLAAQTKAIDTATGVVSETDLEILSHASGELVFMVNKTLPVSTIFGGIITLVKFQAIDDGYTIVETSLD